MQTNQNMLAKEPYISESSMVLIVRTINELDVKKSHGTHSYRRLHEGQGIEESLLAGWV